MTAATVENKFGRTVEQAAKYTVRAKAFHNVVAVMKDSDAEAGSPEFNSLAAERAKAERYLKTATQSLTKKDGRDRIGCHASEPRTTAQSRAAGRELASPARPARQG
jgi:hypothetical protein